MRSGQPLPARIANAPQLRLGLSFYLNAFFDLDAERSMGMGIGRIPWSAILQYATYYELDEEQTDRLFYFIRAIDTAHIKSISESLKK
jgi:hypothetical protein